MNIDENEYGVCSVCNQPFKYADDFIRIEAIRNYQSQGYADQFRLAHFDCHFQCLPSRIGIVQDLIKQRSDINQQ